MVRIPRTINSKYNEELKIIQKWDDNEANANPLVIPFLDHLIQIKIEAAEIKKRKPNIEFKGDSNKIDWIEKLLQTPIPDHRYYCLWHLLLPYLVNIERLPKSEVFSILTKWLDDCNRLNKVRWNYHQKIKEQLRYVKEFAPISLENLKKENHELYKLLQK